MGETRNVSAFEAEANRKHKVLKHDVTADRRRRVTSGDADEAQSARAHYVHHPKQRIQGDTQEGQSR